MDNERNDIMQQKQQEIINLTCDLTSAHSTIGDWKLIKQQEAVTLGLPAPYTDEQMLAYHEQRQAARDRINALQAEIAEMEAQA